MTLFQEMIKDKIEENISRSKDVPCKSEEKESLMQETEVEKEILMPETEVESFEENA